MKDEQSVYDWRAIARKGVFEVLQLLEQNGQMRFGSISKELENLCLASLTSALAIANELGLVKKTSYKITDDGSLHEMTEDDLEEGVRPQATFYKIEEKGKNVLELQERLNGLLRST